MVNVNFKDIIKYINQNTIKRINGGVIMSKILVVDDELDMLKLIENVLKRDRHEVKVISDVEKAMNMDFNYFNLIILDVMMPKMDGFEVCKTIRNKVDCPILFFTINRNFFA